MKIRKADGASGSYRVALPLFSPSAYTLAYRTAALTADGRAGTSPVRFTSHFLEVTTPTTLTFDERLTVCAGAPMILRVAGPPCFNHTRGLTLRPGRIAPPPQVLFPGSFAITIKVTLAHTSKLKFEKQVLDRYGPAQVGFDRPRKAISPFVVEWLSPSHD